MTEQPNISELSTQASKFLDAGKLNEALACYENVLVLDLRNVSAWINKGLALWNLKQNEAALKCYDSALELDPQNALALMNKGNALSALGRQGEVLACYNRALEFDPNLAGAWYNKGDELGRLNRVIEAKACFENAYQLGLPQARNMVETCQQILMNESYG